MRMATSGNIATPARSTTTLERRRRNRVVATVSLMWAFSVGAGCGSDNSESCPEGDCTTGMAFDASSERSSLGFDRLDAGSEWRVADSEAPSDALTIPADSDVADIAIACEIDASSATGSCGVSEANGVFVSPSGNDDTGAGTRAKPYRTLRMALSKVSGTAAGTIYACDTGAGYSETIAIGVTLDGLQMLGGYDCQSWTHDAAHPVLVSAAESTALTISNIVKGITIEDFVFKAGPGTLPSENSVGVMVVASANVTLRRVEIATLAGADGTTGPNGAARDDATAAGGARGNPGVPACTAMTIEGGTGKTAGGAAPLTTCGTSVTSGGAGGPGGVYTGSGVNGTSPNTAGGAGMPGVPQADAGAAASAGSGGVGETNATGRCGPGVDGAAGLDGRYGIGARGLGTLANTGWVGTAGASGEPGEPGGGGGGGGGAKAPGDASACMNLSPNPKTGGSGGSGGAGGCGGQPGTGGKAGGSSIAVVSLDSTALLLDSCTLRPGVGGKGGNGGKGQRGGPGGAAASGGAGLQNLSFGGCAGGVGGSGGAGGPGGGGLGGHSIGVAFRGASPLRSGGVITTSSGGPGGLPGGGVATSAEYAAGRGDSGRSMSEVAF